MILFVLFLVFNFGFMLTLDWFLPCAIINDNSHWFLLCVVFLSEIIFYFTLLFTLVTLISTSNPYGKRLANK